MQLATGNNDDFPPTPSPQEVIENLVVEAQKASYNRHNSLAPPGHDAMDQALLQPVPDHDAIDQALLQSGMGFKEKSTKTEARNETHRASSDGEFSLQDRTLRTKMSKVIPLMDVQGADDQVNIKKPGEMCRNESNFNVIVQPLDLEKFKRHLVYLTKELPPTGVVWDQSKISLSHSKAYREDEEFKKTTEVFGKGSFSGNVIVVEDVKTQQKHAYKVVDIKHFTAEELKCWLDTDNSSSVPTLYLVQIVRNKLEFHMEIQRTGVFQEGFQMNDDKNCSGMPGPQPVPERQVTPEKPIDATDAGTEESNQGVFQEGFQMNDDKNFSGMPGPQPVPERQVTPEKPIDATDAGTEESNQVSIEKGADDQVNIKKPGEMCRNESIFNVIVQQKYLGKFMNYFEYLTEELPPTGVVWDQSKISLSHSKEYREGEEFKKTTEVLGKGLFSGNVIVVEDFKTQQKHAYKVVDIKHFRKEELNCWLDIANLSFVPSLYLVQIVRKKLEFHMEILNKAKTLRSIIDDHMTGFNQNEASRSLVKPFSLYVLDGALEAVSQMHSMGWVHNDLHGGNIMVQIKGAVKLGINFIDFGLAHNFEEGKVLNFHGFRSDIEEVVNLFIALYTGGLEPENKLNLRGDWKRTFAKFTESINMSNDEELFCLVDEAMNVLNPSHLERYRNVVKDRLRKAMGDKQSEKEKVGRIIRILFQEEFHSLH